MTLTRRLIGLYTKIEDSSGNYIRYDNDGPNAGAFRYYDALQMFEETVKGKDVIRTNESDMWDTYMSRLNHELKGYDSYEQEFKNKLKDIGISNSEVRKIWNYILDTLISAKTISYPEEYTFVLDDIDNLPNNTSKFLGYRYLYRQNQDQSRNVDFGMVLRQNADLWISKDLYKTTLLVNGKKQEYFYNKKKSETDSEGNWTLNLTTGDYAFSKGSDAKNRANNKDYIGESYGGNTYTREIRKSEYLYDGTDAGTTDDKNLQVFVTYKIAVKNQSQSIKTRVDEIVDYYDSSQYSYNENDKITQDNTFIGDSKGKKTKELIVREESIYSSNIGYNIIGKKNYAALYLTNMTGYLTPGELKYVYVTFKVKNDNSGKVKLDQVMNDLLTQSDPNNVRDTVGKRNIAEINGYSTREGLVDLDSNAGSLRPKDLDENGNIISSDKEWINRLEDDTDKAGNLKLKIDTNNDDIRRFSGYVFEDARTEVSDGAVIGNGRYNEGDGDFEGNKDKKINGVTVQLVELVQKVDPQGFATGSYEGEHIWASVTYDNAWNKIKEDTSRYYSGTNTSKVILSGPGIFEVKPTSLTEGAGEYRYESLPPGDFFIRFVYGDTTQTVLTNGTDGSDEVQKLFNENAGLAQSAVNNNSYYKGMLGTSGLNVKSYTGQDYKSTIYQRGVEQDPSVNTHTYRARDGEIKQDGIYGFTNRENQNYGIQGQDFNYDTNEPIQDSDKAVMYNYSIKESDKDHTISDAKDVYSYREREQKYSSGSELSYLSGVPTLKNYRAEVLASATDEMTKVNDYLNKGMKAEAINYQVNAIRELMENTMMVSQTGIINSEIEYDRTTTNVYNQETKEYIQDLYYNLSDVNLGLTERPRAQLNLSKELANIQIVLANGQTLFDASQSVTNLIYQQHKTYNESEYYKEVNDGGNIGYRLARENLRRAVEERVEELVQATMDEELMSGAKIRVTYKISVNNVGEVDFMDKDFYYIGKTNNKNLSNYVRTNAMNVIDYVSNELNYEATYQEQIDNWRVVSTDELLGVRDTEDDDYVNDIYEDHLKTYNVLVTSNKLSADLVPRAADPDKTNYSNSSKEVSLILSTILSNSKVNKNYIYNNLTELIEIKNTFGRRSYLSKVGNQYMPYQSDDKTKDESTYWIQPNEPDADSAQRVQTNVPTGENRNYNRAIVLAITSFAIIIGAVVLIKNKVLKDKNKMP